MDENLRRRPPAEVFDDHLRLAGEHRFDEDIDRNVAPDCVFLQRRAVFHGRGMIGRRLAVRISQRSGPEDTLGGGQPPSASRAATTMFCTPVSMVGCSTGANLGLWLVGMSSAIRPASAARRHVSASMPPTYQNTDGTPHSVPNDPKSSLAEYGADISPTRSSPKWARRAAATRPVRPASLMASVYLVWPRAPPRTLAVWGCEAVSIGDYHARLGFVCWAFRSVRMRRR